MTGIYRSKSAANRQKKCLHQHNVQQDSLHGIESTIPTEVLIVDDTKIDCKEDGKAAEQEKSAIQAVSKRLTSTL